MSIDNLDIIKRLIAEKECGRVEFKETTGQLERGMETLCAFLNGEGGTVLFGVTDKGKIIGQDVSDKTKRDIADAIRRIEPFATVEVSRAKTIFLSSCCHFFAIRLRFSRLFLYLSNRNWRNPTMHKTICQI